MSNQSKKQETIDTYNRSASGLAAKFNDQGARVSDIEETFRLVSKQNPKVLEIGCGNGREAFFMLKHTNNYIGMDIAEKLLELAKVTAPSGEYQLADVVSFEFPKDLDVVFAFASLIHVEKEEFKKILENMYEAMNTGAVARISIKYSPSYIESTKEDKFGVRTYYLYSENDIQDIAGKFSIFKMEKLDLRDQSWLEIILQK